MTVLALPLAASHRAALVRHFLALDREDLQLRFGRAVSPEWITATYVAGLDFERDAVYGVVADDLELTGVAHLAIVDDAAELGISVLADHRGRGIGTVLLARAIAHARNQQVRTFFMHCLAENAAMMHIAKSAGMRIVRDSSDADAYLRLPPGDPASYAAEMLQDRLALFDFALKSQVTAARIVGAAVSGQLKPPRQ